MKSYRPGVMRVNPWCEIWELNGATSSHGFLQDFPRTTEQAGGRPEPGRLHAPPGVPHEPRSDTSNRLYNVDLAPTSRYGRTWSAYSIFTMRANDVHSPWATTASPSASSPPDSVRGRCSRSWVWARCRCSRP